jgi:hypothetical protein
MSFRKIYLNLLWLTALLCSASCTKEIEMDFPQEPDQLVIYSLFHPDSVWQVSVSTTKDLNTPFAPYDVVNEAVVEIYQGQQLVDQLEFQGYLDPTRVQDNVRGITYDTVFWRNEHIYRSEEGFKPEAGVAYTVVVSAPGYNSVTATDQIPRLPLIEVEEVGTPTDRNWPGINPNDEYITTTAVVHDVDGENNYYLTGASYMLPRYQYEDGVVYDTLYRHQYLETATFEIRSISLYPYELFSDQSFYGISYPVLIGVRLDQGFTFNEVNRLSLHTGIVSEAFYKYYKSAERQKLYGVDLVNLTDPPIIYSNVEGVLGIFAGYNTIDFDVHL